MGGGRFSPRTANNYEVGCHSGPEAREFDFLLWFLKEILMKLAPKGGVIVLRGGGSPGTAHNYEVGGHSGPEARKFDFTLLFLKGILM